MKIPTAESPESERFDFIYELFRGVRKLPRGKDGARRFPLTKEKFMELKAIMTGGRGSNEFFDKAEKEGTEFGLYDDIAVLCGIAGPYYKDAEGKDKIYIVIRS